jgi:DHA1 family multidrug resistance protein-like MFS transporter
MTPVITLVLARFLARSGYQRVRSPVLPRFAQDLGAAPEMLGLIGAASTITGVVIKLPAGTLSDVLGEAAGPILAGFLIASLRNAPAFTLIAALMVVVAIIFAVLVRAPHTAYGQA